MDAITDPDITTVVMMTSAQIGKTEILLNAIGYYVDQDPSPMLLLQPTLEMAEAFSKDRLAPMIRDTPALQGSVKEPRTKDSDNRIRHKRFPGGHITLAGANSPNSLAMRPIRILLADELDRYPASAGGEGDPVNLAIKRTANFHNRKIVLTSTPTTKGISRIEAAFEASDKRRLYIPCPRCGDFDFLRWDRMHWQKEKLETGKHKHDPESARILCQNCDRPIRDREKPAILAAAEWRPTAEGDGRTAGFHLSAMCSPWVPWPDGVRDFLASKKAGEETLRVWVNTYLGESWEEDGEDVDHGVLYQRRADYGAQVPADVCLLTAGVDIQKDRIEMEVIGWTPLEESYGISYQIFHGDVEQSDVWEQLDLGLRETWKHSTGAQLGLAAACIDAGFKTQQVYDFVRRRSGRRIFAVMGKDGPGRPLVSAPSAKRTGRNRRPVPLYTLGVDQIKSLVYSRWRIPEEGAGYCHFPLGNGYDEEVFSQFTSERIVTRYRKGVPYQAWVLKRTRNEALDCRVYGTAGLVILGPKALAAAARRLAARIAATPDEEKPKPRRPRKKNWTTGWK